MECRKGLAAAHPYSNASNMTWYTLTTVTMTRLLLLAPEVLAVFSRSAHLRLPWTQDASRTPRAHEPVHGADVCKCRMARRSHASALVASIGNAKNFKNGRQVAAWLGLVPAQDSSGGKTKLLGISKHGDVYLRTLLIHGARSVLRHLKQRPNHTDSWLARLVARRNRNVAAVALANKNARIAWALLAHQRDFEPDYVSVAPTR
jgi:hypothetical protein